MLRFAALFGLFLLLSASVFARSPGVTNDKIKIGLIGPITGQASLFRKTLYGAMAIYRDINDRGGINGRRLELVVEDDGCDAETGVEALRTLISEEKVFLVHGAFCDSVALAIKNAVAKEPSLPYVVLGSTRTEISTPVLPNVFQPVPTAKVVAQQMADFALSKPGAARIGIVRTEGEWGAAFLEPAMARLAERGITPVQVLSVKRDSADLSSEVLALKNAQPDVVLAILTPPDFALYLRTCYAQNFHAITVTTDVATFEDIDRRIGIPAALKDVFFGYTLKYLTTSPELSKYAELFRTYYPSESLDAMSLNSMTGALAIAKALESAGHNLSRESFIAELNRLRNFAPGIFYGDLSFSPSDHSSPKAIRFISLVNQKPRIYDSYPTQP